MIVTVTVVVTVVVVVAVIVAVVVGMRMVRHRYYFFPTLPLGFGL